MTRPTGNRRPGRPYCEAFPALDVHEVIRAAAEDRVHLQWEDEDRLIIGHVSTLMLEEERYRFHSRFFGTRNVESGNGPVEVVIARRQAGRYWRKPVFLCPACARDATRLYYVRGIWACRRCHDLLTITQRLDQVNKAIYLRDTLRDKLNLQPTTATGHRKTEKRRNKYGAAVRILADETRSELPEQLTYRSIGRWLEPGELPKAKVRRGQIGYGWVPGMHGQLAGLMPIPRAPSRRKPAGTEQAAGGVVPPSRERLNGTEASASLARFRKRPDPAPAPAPKPYGGLSFSVDRVDGAAMNLSTPFGAFAPLNHLQAKKDN